MQVEIRFLSRIKVKIPTVRQNYQTLSAHLQGISRNSTDPVHRCVISACTACPEPICNLYKMSDDPVRQSAIRAATSVAPQSKSISSLFSSLRQGGSIKQGGNQQRNQKGQRQGQPGGKQQAGFKQAPKAAALNKKDKKKNRGDRLKDLARENRQKLQQQGRGGAQNNGAQNGEGKKNKNKNKNKQGQQQNGQRNQGQQQKQQNGQQQGQKPKNKDGKAKRKPAKQGGAPAAPVDPASMDMELDSTYPPAARTRHVRMLIHRLRLPADYRNASKGAGSGAEGAAAASS